MPDNHISFENKDYYIELGLNIAFYRKRAGLTPEPIPPQRHRSPQHHPLVFPGNPVPYCPRPGCGTVPAPAVQGLAINLKNSTNMQPYLDMADVP